jgi:uncharacterized integral membrane protein
MLADFAPLLLLILGCAVTGYMIYRFIRATK